MQFMFSIIAVFHIPDVTFLKSWAMKKDLPLSADKYFLDNV
jgi:hypothetical protein